MTHIADLATSSYMGLQGPIRAVGWLESSHDFNRGSVDPQFRRRLLWLVERRLFGTIMLGIHYCSLCAAEGRVGPDSRSSQAELLIPSTNCVYEAPIWIGHYVQRHGYRPPEEFMTAAIACPEPGTPEYRKAIQAHIPGFSNPEWFKVSRLDVRRTLKSDPRYGDKAAADARIAILKRETPPVPTRDEMIEKQGGLSNVKCAWAKCSERALAGLAVCFEHAYPKWPH